VQSKSISGSFTKKTAKPFFGRGKDSLKTWQDADQTYGIELSGMEIHPDPSRSSDLRLIHP
jgi:hypothetical protein